MNFTELIDVVTSFFSTVFSDGAAVLIAIFTWAFNGLLYVIAYPLLFVLDGVLAAFYMIFSVMNFSSLVFDWIGTFAGLPPALLYLLDACGFPAGLTIVSTAIGVRIILNLIPGAVTRI